MSSMLLSDEKPYKSILHFFFPILWGTFFQQLYNTLDAIIVGKFLGKAALAAVGGGTSTIITLLIGFFTGVASGSAVVISHHYGANDEERLNNAIKTAISLALVGSLFITLFGLLSAKWSLEVIATPTDVLPLALKYIRIYYIGSVTLILFNMGSGVFRALGDSHHPLYFLIIGCVLNIILDILFVAILKLGVEGAAYATIISQAASTFLTLIYLKRADKRVRFKICSFYIDRLEVSKMLKIGLPTGVQSILYTLSNLVVQANVNSFGTDSAAAWAALGKLDCLVWMVINAFGIAITTYAGQNYGSGRLERVKKGVKSSLILSFTTVAILSALYLIFARAGFSIFTNDKNVIDIGSFMLRCIAPSYILYVAIEILSGTIRGCGKVMIPTIICLFGICVLRVVWITLLSRVYNSILVVILCYPITWAVSTILFIIYYKRGRWLVKQ